MISREEIKNLAELARLELTDEEIAKLELDMSNILDYVGQISTFTASVEDKNAKNHNVMREDVPRGDDLLAGKREALLGALPKKEGDYAVVRKIIQKDE
ncbi:MAG TPA: Asp-tRNA(Asn)/Glu-tRNA(Gln) amidotransferase subunit GatC [Candidatus Paceibacterota bacterium]|nr:Asp-tRNA(Asn)/Glu-tRNA(Gln) amidotransferase subunit GatC [Candidatus Paceibacterota bacterium]